MKLLKRRNILFTILFTLCTADSVGHPGIGIVSDSKGNVYYTDLVHVWKISNEGKRTIAVRDVHTHELYIDEHDNLYGEHEWYEGEETDQWGNYVWCLGYDGVLEKSVPDVVGFLDNNTLVRDSKGNSFWVKKEGQKRTIMITDLAGNSSVYSEYTFTDIRWMYFSNLDGTLYVVDLLSVLAIDQDGNVNMISNRLKLPDPPFEDVDDRHYVYGMATDTLGALHVAVFGASEVVKIDSTGQKRVYKSESGWSPCGVLFSKHYLWVMEFSENNETRIIRLDSSGIKEIYE